MTEARNRKNPLGPTGETVRHNVKRLRGARTYKSLSEDLEKIGRPIAPLGLRRIEEGERRVDSDDLVALSLALGVTPVALLMPAESNIADTVRVEATGAPSDLMAGQLWDWLRGSYPIDHPLGENRHEITPDVTAFRRTFFPTWALMDELTEIGPGREQREMIAEVVREELDRQIGELQRAKRGND